MKLTNEQARQLQEKLAAEKNPAEAAKVAGEYGIDISAEDMEQLLEQVSGGGRLITDAMLAQVSGGGRQYDIPEAALEATRMGYARGGPSMAVLACIYYIPSPLCNEIVDAIEREEKAKK